MRKVRYNDRMWFGKHKGVRVCELIKGDPSYIIKIQKENNISFDEKCMENINKRFGSSRSIFGNNNDDQDVLEAPSIPSLERKPLERKPRATRASVSSSSGRWTTSGYGAVPSYDDRTTVVPSSYTDDLEERIYATIAASKIPQTQLKGVVRNFNPTVDGLQNIIESSLREISEIRGDVLHIATYYLAKEIIKLDFTNKAPSITFNRREDGGFNIFVRDFLSGDILYDKTF